MDKKKIVACLDIKDGRVVKGVQFVDIKDVCDPVEAAVRYEKEGADELVFLDIMASFEGRKTMLDVVKKVADAVTIPFTVGGGISDVEWIGELFSAGVQKASINSAAMKRPEFIDEAVSKFGSDRIVVAIDCKQRDDKSGWDTYLNGGRVNANMDLLEWSAEVEKRGAGEILLTSMDADGSKKGFDVESIKLLKDALKIRVTASGGAGSKEHFYEVFQKGNADAALAASLFHFREVSISDLKQYLAEKGIAVIK